MSGVSLETIKDSVHSNTEFQKLLKQHAVSDAKHDLGDAFTSIYNDIKIKKKAKGEEDKVIPGYKHIGTPLPGEAVPAAGSGWDIVSSLVKTADLDSGLEGDVKEIWILEKNKEGEVIKNEYSFDMNHTGFQYKVKLFEISEKSNPLSLFNALSDNKKEMLLIYDFSTGPFMDALQRVEKKEIEEANRKNIVFVINREVISDPAPKPNSVDAKYRYDENRYVNFTFAYDTSKETVMYPAWNKEREDYRWDFFSNFDLYLTSIEYNDQKSTSLKFADETYTNESKINTSQTGKMANSKNAMIELLRKIQVTLKKLLSPSKEDKDYFVMLQKKRSGDSLMVLSYFDRNRTYTERQNMLVEEDGKFKYKVTKINEWNLQTKLNSENELFVLTHDTFNTLPISLANGANVLYCGAPYKVEDGGKEIEKQIMYVFRLQSEPIDVISDFYTQFTKYTEIEKNSIWTLIENCISIYEANINFLLGRLEASINKALTQKEEFLTVLSTLKKRDEISKTKTKAIDIMNKQLQDVYRNLYTFVIYVDKYKPYVSSDILKLNISEIFSSRLSTEIREKVETVRNAYVLFIAKAYETISDEAETEFEKEIKNNKVITEAIPAFQFIQKTGVFDLFKKHSRLLFGTIPLVLNVIQKGKNSWKKQFADFIELLKNLQGDDLFKTAALKDSIELWKTFTKQFKYESAGKKGDFLDVVGNLPLPQSVPQTENAEKNRTNQEKQTLIERVQVLNEMSAVVVQEIAGIKMEESTLNEMDVDTDTTANPYHLFLKSDIEKDDTIVDETLEIMKRIEKGKKIKTISEDIKTVIESVATGGDASQKEKINLQLFFRFLGINTLIVAAHYDDTFPISEQDNFNVNLPYLVSMLGFFTFYSRNISLFVLFAIQMMYYTKEGDEFEKDYKDIFMNSPSLKYLPSLVLEVLQLTFTPKQVEEIQNLSIEYPSLKSIIEPALPKFPRHMLPTKKQMFSILFSWLVDTTQQIDTLLSFEVAKEKSTSESEPSLLSMLPLPKRIGVKAGGQFRKTRKQLRK